MLSERRTYLRWSAWLYTPIIQSATARKSLREGDGIEYTSRLLHLDKRLWQCWVAKKGSTSKQTSSHRGVILSVPKLSVWWILKTWFFRVTFLIATLLFVYVNVLTPRRLVRNWCSNKGIPSLSSRKASKIFKLLIVQGIVIKERKKVCKEILAQEFALKGRHHLQNVSGQMENG